LDVPCPVKQHKQFSAIKLLGPNACLPIQLFAMIIVPNNLYDLCPFCTENQGVCLVLFAPTISNVKISIFGECAKTIPAFLPALVFSASNHFQAPEFLAGIHINENQNVTTI